MAVFRKVLSSWLSACATFLDAVLTVCVLFPFGVWGRMWNSIVSVPDHCCSSTSSNMHAIFTETMQ